MDSSAVLPGGCWGSAAKSCSPGDDFRIAGGNPKAADGPHAVRWRGFAFRRTPSTMLRMVPLAADPRGGFMTDAPDRDILFVAMTRPQMLLGVTYGFAIGKSVITTELLLIFKSV